MIVSRTLRYVYIGIPRTGSKSMNRWLMDNFAGNFFDHFTLEDEKLLWEYAAEDFEPFGYRRFDCGLPDK
jgi:hypothetical protein